MYLIYNKIMAFLAGLIVGFAMGYIVWGAPTPATASLEITNGIDHRVCIRGRCPTPTPIPPTPTPEPVYHSLCREYACVQVEGEGDSECKVDEDCQPEVTPTPTQEPEPEVPHPQPQLGTGDWPSAYMCPDGSTTILPVNPHILRSGDTAVIKWNPSEGNRVNIYYRLVESTAWEHAVRDELNDGYVQINGLADRSWTFGIQQTANCSGGPIVVIPDGSTSTWRMFLPTHIEW